MSGIPEVEDSKREESEGVRKSDKVEDEIGLSDFKIETNESN